MTTPPAPDESNRQADLEHVIAILRRRAGLILLCFLVTAGAAFGFSELQQKQYSASASLLFRNSGFAEDLFGTTPTPVNPRPEREAATNVKLVGLQVIAARTAKQLKGLSAEEVASMVSVSSEGEAELVSVTATSPIPAQTKRVANEFARQFIAFRAGADKSRLLWAKRLADREFASLSPAQRAGVRGESLSRAAEKLSVLASLQTGNAELVQPADLPTSPSSPKPVRNGVLGGVLGLLLGIGLAFLLERLDRRIREPKDLEAIYGLPLLGVIPESDALSRAARPDGGARDVLPPGEAEAFRMIRAHLRYFNVDHDLRTLLVISAAQGDGKTTVARHLAEAAAAMGARTLLVEADLRAPTLATQLGIAPGPGLSDVLSHSDLTLNEAIQSLDVGPLSNEGRAQHQMDVLVSGFMQPPNPAELIESRAMQTVLEQAKSAYEFVVIDTPPLTAVSDAFPLLSKVDGIVIVGRIGRNRRDAEGFHETLRPVEAPLLGVVANGFKARGRTPYAYGYQGDEGPSPSVDPLEAVASQPPAGRMES